MKRIENERTAEKKVTFTKDYNKKRGPDHGTEQWTRGQDFQRRNQNFTTIDLGEHLLLPTRIFRQDQTLHMGITIRIMEGRMINAKISQLTETMEIDLETDLSTTRMGTGETMEIFLVLRRLKEEASHKITSIANQELTNLITLRSADLTIELRLFLLPMNKNSRKLITRQHLMWFVLPQPTILLTKYHIFAR